MINAKAKEVISPIPTRDIEHDHWIAIHLCKYGHIDYIDKPLLQYRQHTHNTLGANDGGLPYLLNKSRMTLANRELFINKYSHFSFPVSLWKIFFSKIALNLARLFS